MGQMVFGVIQHQSLEGNTNLCNCKVKCRLNWFVLPDISFILTFVLVFRQKDLIGKLRIVILLLSLRPRFLFCNSLLTISSHSDYSKQFFTKKIPLNKFTSWFEKFIEYEAMGIQFTSRKMSRHWARSCSYKVLSVRCEKQRVSVSLPVTFVS